MARRYIADCHFDHEALNVAMDKRGFNSVESMNEYMIKQWNSVVKRGDDVIILGDFCVSRDPERIRKLLLQLNGKKYMILGNHDSGIRNKQFDTTLFRGIYDYHKFSDCNKSVICSHYPILMYEGEYRKCNNGENKNYMLCGHVHDTSDNEALNRYIIMERERAGILGRSGEEVIEHPPANIINCFTVFSDYKPFTLEEWIKLTEKRLSDC